LTERRVYAPYGLAGGGTGAKGENTLNKANGEKIKLASKAELDVEPGDLLIIKTPGGGAYGAYN
jgi:N-methylhydantoinase B/oxoprolinase/acetone carboxylase alpha subunit